MVDRCTVHGYARTAATAAVRSISVGARLRRSVRIVAVADLVGRAFFNAVPFGEFAALSELVCHRLRQAHYSPVFLPQPQKLIQDAVPFGNRNDEAAFVPRPMGCVETEPDPLDGQAAQLIKELFEIVLVLFGDRCVDDRFARGLLKVFDGAVVGALPPDAVVDLLCPVERQDPLGVICSKALRTVCEDKWVVKNP